MATLSEPNVRPPSRYQTGVLQYANGDFSCDLWGKIRIFRCVRVFFGNFVIMVLSFFFFIFFIFYLVYCLFYNILY